MHSAPYANRGEQDSDTIGDNILKREFCFERFHVWGELIFVVARFRGRNLPDESRALKWA